MFWLKKDKEDKAVFHYQNIFTLCKYVHAETA